VKPTGKAGWLAFLVTAAVAVAACTAPTTSHSQGPVQKSSHKPVTLNVWTFFTGRELNTFKSALKGLHSDAPWITVNVTGGKQLEDIQRGINSGTAPDVAMEVGPDDVAKYGQSGAWIDLNPYIQADHTDVSKLIVSNALDYTSYQGKQVALPLLSDAYGLYYNTQLLQQAGITTPPRTYSELFADAKKLTTFNPDGSIKVAGFVPLSNFYETPQIENGVWSNAQWYTGDGKSALDSDPAWKALVSWQKQFVDFYGFDKLTKFYAALGGPDSEWSSSNAFEQGKVAMTLDGEWRVASIQADQSKVPYATAPFPVADSMSSSYGLGQIGGTIVGIPRGTSHPADSWEVVKYLTTNTRAVSTLAEALKNVPTTYAALKDPALTKDTHFKVFMRIFADPKSRYKQLTPLGTADVDTFSQWLGKYLAGNGGSVDSGLKGVAQQIDSQSQLGG
jgi:multiple sugar transport system substrate-binding protein